MTNYIVAIPFYKNEHFIQNFINWHKNPAAAIDVELIYKVIIINDCPSSYETNQLKKESIEAGFVYIENKENIGYLKSANVAYNIAKSDDKNLLLLNSDTIPTAGFLYEINEAFKADVMLGIASARSNNGSVCNLFSTPREIENNQSINNIINIHSQFKKYAPQISYSPVVTGFCFAISNKLLKIFMGFDEHFSPGYEEENDYCLRVAQYGFRIGISNRSLVLHYNGKSFSYNSNSFKIRQNNLLKIKERYSYYDTLMIDHFRSIDYLSTLMIAEACENSTKLFIDASSLTPDFNGSNRLMIKIMEGLSQSNCSIDVFADGAAFYFHELEKLNCLNLVVKPKGIYEYAIRLCQPMTLNQLTLSSNSSLVSTCVFQDTIAHDCPQLRTKTKQLNYLWSKLTYLYNNIVFISEHSLQQYQIKFGNGFANMFSILTPTSIGNCELYDNSECDNSILIFANNFLHKGVHHVLEELPSDLGYTYYVLCDPVEIKRNDVEFIKPGALAQSSLELLMKNAAFFVYPSYSEGYGIPLTEAASRGKPIYCRNIPCYQEIAMALPEDQKDLIRFVENFKNFTKHTRLSYIKGVKNLKTSQNFLGYARLILCEMQNISPKDVYKQLKFRNMNPPSIDSRESSIGMLKKIRRKFYRYINININKQPFLRRIRIKLGIKKVA